MKRFKKKYICHVYILIWFLYNFHWQSVGEAFPILNALSNLFLGINLAISLYYTYYFLTHYKQTRFFVSMNYLLISLILYGSISLLMGAKHENISPGTYLIGALRSFLPIYTCYVFTKIGYLNEKAIKVWFWMFLSQSIYIFFVGRTVMRGVSLLDMGEMYTNNISYMFVSIFPWLYFWKDRRGLTYVIIALLLFLTFFGLKRGAIMIVLMATIYFFLHQFKQGSIYAKITIIAILSLFVIKGASIIENMYDNSDIFQKRYASTLEGDTSGRDRIVNNLLDIYFSSDIIDVIFGKGADATLKYGLFAHNDWVELLFNQGLVGFFLYFFFWFNIVLLWRKQIKLKSEISFLLGLCIICYLPKTFFSMWYSNANIMMTLPIGYSLAIISNNRFVKVLDSK